MPFGIDDALLILAAASGGAEAIWGGKPSDAQEELMKALKYQFEHGLKPEVESEIAGLYAPRVSRGITEAQNRLARIHNVRGTGSSTELGMSVGQLPTVGQSVSDIVAKYDIEARTGAAQPYSDLISALAGQRSEAISSGLGTAGMAVAQFADEIPGWFGGEETAEAGSPDFGLKTPEGDELFGIRGQDQSYFKGKIGGGQPLDFIQGLGLDSSIFENMTEEELEQLLQYLVSNQTITNPGMR